MKILGIGETVLDKVQTIEKGRHITHENIYVGGPVTAALIVLARLGAQCHYLTSVGDDTGATTITNVLEQEGISCTYTLQAATKVNTMMINHRGQRTKVRSATKHTPLTHISMQRIHEADMIIMDRHEPQAFYEVIRHKRPSTSVIIDPSTEVSAFTLDMMEAAEHPIVPIETLEQLGVHNTSAALRALYNICGKPVVVTMGELGSLLYDGNETEIIPSCRIRAVDTTGAGDVYRGAYGYGILSGWSRTRSAAFANAVAALQCTTLGNHTAIPDIDTLQKLANEVQTAEMHEVHNRFHTLLPQMRLQTV